MVAHESGLSHPTAALGRRAWRIVSEDSIHPMTSLPTAVHPFPESKNLVVVLIAKTSTREQRYCASPETVVLCLRSHDRKTIEEGHDTASQIGESIDLPIPAAVPRLTHGPAPQGLPKEIQRRTIVL